VVGGSGSGKTWIAEELVRVLAPEAVRVSLDDFYRDLSTLPESERTGCNFDEPMAIDWEAVELAMASLDHGETAWLPQYDFATHTRRRETRAIAPVRGVIWDGLWLLHTAALRARFVFSLFVDCPVAERLRRRTHRDQQERGRTRASVRRQFEEQVQPLHGQHVEPQRRWATRVVHSPLAAGTWRQLGEEVRAALGLGGS
jgi:uridine kinase